MAYILIRHFKQVVLFLTALMEGIIQTKPLIDFCMLVFTQCLPLYLCYVPNQSVHISRDISWERQSQDYVRAFYSSEIMNEIREFAHIIIRFGVTGSIYSSVITEEVKLIDNGNRRIHRVFFDPNAKHCGIYRHSEQHGDVIGYQALFASCSILEVIKYHINNVNDDIDFVQLVGTIGDGIRKSIIACQVFFDNGYGTSHKNVKECFADIKKYISDKVYSLNNNEITREKYKKIANERITIDSPNWSILKQSAEYRLLDIAEKLVFKEVGEVLNSPLPDYARRGMNGTIWAPVITFENKENQNAKLVVIDRREIESYKAVHALLGRSMSTFPGRPLSVGVFGPPGSGKSFVVKTLIASAKPADIEIDIKTINMANYSDWDDVKDEINKIQKKEKHSDRLPIIFFDEFDSSLNATELAWLKSFLPLMEDWKKPKECKRKKGSPILIFAGGTSHNYADFSREDSSITDVQKVNFAMAKGPDFVSRLCGHINILGPNRVDDEDDGHVIRRAIILREFLKDSDPSNKGITKIIELAVVKAMLRVSSFKHGARSMRAVLNMCGKVGGNNGIILSSTLPILPQLNMHVNGKEFLDMVIEKKGTIK